MPPPLLPCRTPTSPVARSSMLLSLALSPLPMGAVARAIQFWFWWQRWRCKLLGFQPAPPQSQPSLSSSPSCSTIVCSYPADVPYQIWKYDSIYCCTELKNGPMGKTTVGDMRFIWPMDQDPSSMWNSCTIYMTCIFLRLAGMTVTLTVPRSFLLGTRKWLLWFCCVCSTSSGAEWIQDPFGLIPFAMFEMAKFYGNFIYFKAILYFIIWHNSNQSSKCIL